jgi:hypothetical protein
MEVGLRMELIVGDTHAADALVPPRAAGRVDATPDFRRGSGRVGSPSRQPRNPTRPRSAIASA